MQKRNKPPHEIDACYLEDRMKLQMRWRWKALKSGASFRTSKFKFTSFIIALLAAFESKVLIALR